MRAELGSLVSSTLQLQMDSEQKQIPDIDDNPVRKLNLPGEVETIEVRHVPSIRNFNETAAIAFLSPHSQIGDDISKTAGAIAT